MPLTMAGRAPASSGAGRDHAAGDHEREPGDDDPSLAEALADDAAGAREERAGQHVDAEEPPELRIAQPEVLDHQRRHGGHRLELKAHRRARDEDDRQRNPAVGHVGPSYRPPPAGTYVTVISSESNRRMNRHSGRRAGS
jgi:hypothetical protein